MLERVVNVLEYLGANRHKRRWFLENLRVDDIKTSMNWVIKKIWYTDEIGGVMEPVFPPHMILKDRDRSKQGEYIFLPGLVLHDNLIKRIGEQKRVDIEIETNLYGLAISKGFLYRVIGHAYEGNIPICGPLEYVTEIKY